MEASPKEKSKPQIPIKSLLYPKQGGGLGEKQNIRYDQKVGNTSCTWGLKFSIPMCEYYVVSGFATLNAPTQVTF